MIAAAERAEAHEFIQDLSDARVGTATTRTWASAA